MMLVSSPRNVQDWHVSVVQQLPSVCLDTLDPCVRVSIQACGLAIALLPLVKGLLE